MIVASLTHYTLGEHAGWAALVIDQDGWHYTYSIGDTDQASAGSLAYGIATYDRQRRLAARASKGQNT